jgi:hypothetical protein
MERRCSVSARFHVCQVERLKHIRKGTLTVDGPKYTSESDEIQKCGTPLFFEADEKRGICSSCLSGWQVDGNRPTEAGRKMIAAGAATKCYRIAIYNVDGTLNSEQELQDLFEFEMPADLDHVGILEQAVKSLRDAGEYPDDKPAHNHEKYTPPETVVRSRAKRQQGGAA